SKKRKDTSDTWALSGSVGGRLLPLDPLFSQDEKYILVASRNSILVYSTVDSLLYRRIDPGQDEIVSCFALSKVDPNKIFVGTTKGKIIEANWINGTTGDTFKLGSRIISIAVSKTRSAKNDIVDFVDVEEPTETQRLKIWKICRWNRSAAEEKPHVLLARPKSLKEIQVRDSGRVIIAPFERQLLCLLAPTSNHAQEQAKEVEWYQVEAPDFIVSLDAKVPTSAVSGPSKNKATATSTVPVVDVAIGTIRGQIYIYDDILSKLVDMDKSKEKKPAGEASKLSPRLLHWHRGPVNTTKWSLDGNYIISGGNETVMMLWQLQTGKRQELPHLTSAIDSATVSPSGTAYGIQLADNSIIVLSTAELQPTAHVSGIQTLISPQIEYELPDLKTVATEQSKEQDSFDASEQIPALLRPDEPNLLLAAVPASQPWTEPSSLTRSKPFLQTYNMSTAQNISRQALTRNNATYFITGPEGNRLGEPDIKFIAISANSRWLATVEEWAPPRLDLEFTSIKDDPASMLNERGIRLESYLKFWRWDKQNNEWALETRIDTPHMFPDNTTPARILDLVADPTRPEFVTTGQDGHIRIWRARQRFRENGVAVRTPAGGPLITWSAKRTVELESPVHEVEDGFTIRLKPSTARLAHSHDGSLIASCHEYAGHEGYSISRFIDPTTGEVVHSRPDLFTSGLAGVGFVSKYLVVLSDSLTVWNLIDDDLHYQYQLNSHLRMPRFLAVNDTSDTFAIALPYWKKGKKYRVAIFHTSKPEPVFVSKRLDTVTALLSVPQQSGYVFLNDQA
ncbi:WD40 repeat-like protein, partial [Rhizodiscina lignyota]